MSFQDRIEEYPLNSGRLFLLRTGIDDVVSWRGAVVANPVFEHGQDLHLHLLAGMLDKGTRRRDRFAIADLLEGCGAQLGFTTSGIRLGFWGRSLRADVPDVLRVMAEQLREPAFEGDEFEKARQRGLASVQRSMEDTGYLASAGLSRLLYTPRHPNYIMPTEEEMETLRTLQREEVIAFYERHIGANELLLVMVGDLEAGEARKAAEEGLGSWGERLASPRFAVKASRRPGGERIVHAMADRPNLDVRIGHALTIRRDADEYPALYLANHILGGNFSSRLMDTVRDDLGLTYGIHSSLAGVSTRYEGHWKISVTLSQEHLERGIEATLLEVRRFVDEGPTERELQENRTTIAGAFNVKLSTTTGLAETMLAGLRNRFGPAYLDEWPARIEALTMEEVRRAIERHFHPDRADVSIAGTIVE
jgi:predicted Zn-dependent peptidase